MRKEGARYAWETGIYEELLTVADEPVDKRTQCPFFEGEGEGEDEKNDEIAGRLDKTDSEPEVFTRKLFLTVGEGCAGGYAASPCFARAGGGGGEEEEEEPFAGDEEDPSKPANIIFFFFFALFSAFSLSYCSSKMRISPARILSSRIA